MWHDLLTVENWFMQIREREDYLLHYILWHRFLE